MITGFLTVNIASPEPYTFSLVLATAMTRNCVRLSGRLNIITACPFSSVITSHL